MKKIFKVFIIMLLAFSINMSNAFAAQEVNDDAANRGAHCAGVFGDISNPNDIAFYMQRTFVVMKFLGPALVIVMSIIDLIKITAEAKQDEQLQKLGGKTLKRLVYAAVLFVLPDAINLIFGMVGLYGTCGVR